MVHENDPERNGCEFAQMFQTTPQDLIDDGLYKSIAIALHEMPHREVSLALVAQACGAKPSKTKQRPRTFQLARGLKRQASKQYSRDTPALSQAYLTGSETSPLTDPRAMTG